MRVAYLLFDPASSLQAGQDALRSTGTERSLARCRCFRDSFRGFSVEVSQLALAQVLHEMPQEGLGHTLKVVDVSRGPGPCKGFLGLHQKRCSQGTD